MHMAIRTGNTSFFALLSLLQPGNYAFSAENISGNIPSQCVPPFLFFYRKTEFFTFLCNFFVNLDDIVNDGFSRIFILDDNLTECVG